MCQRAREPSLQWNACRNQSRSPQSSRVRTAVADVFRKPGVQERRGSYALHRGVHVQSVSPHTGQHAFLQHRMAEAQCGELGGEACACARARRAGVRWRLQWQRAIARLHSRDHGTRTSNTSTCDRGPDMGGPWDTRAKAGTLISRALTQKNLAINVR